MAVLVALPALFLLSAFFSGAETVLFSLTGAQRERIRAKSAAADALITKCLADKAVLFSTLLVGNTLVNFAISTLGFLAFRAYVPGGSWLAVPSMTVLLLVFGEITPKRLALRYAERLAPPCVRLLRFWRFVLRPFKPRSASPSGMPSSLRRRVCGFSGSGASSCGLSTMSCGFPPRRLRLRSSARGGRFPTKNL